MKLFPVGVKSANLLARRSSLNGLIGASVDLLLDIGLLRKGIEAVSLKTVGQVIISLFVLYRKIFDGF